MCPQKVIAFLSPNVQNDRNFFLETKAKEMVPNDLPMNAMLKTSLEYLL
jgi:hypothetical protein